jgi:hypothetical protein
VEGLRRRGRMAAAMCGTAAAARGTARRHDCVGMRQRGGMVARWSGRAAAALEKSASRRLGFGFGGLKTAADVRLKRLRSAFHAMTGRGGRLTGRGGRLTGRDGAASSQSPVSSWHDRTCPVRDDRTLIESGQSLPGNLTRMTGRGGGGWDRTRWSQRRVRCSVQSQILEKIFGMTGRAGGRRDRTR